jgi:hypothetical protein
LRNLQAREFARQQAEAQQRLVQEQIQLAQAQRKALQLQQWAAQWQAQKSGTAESSSSLSAKPQRQIPLPTAEYNNRTEGKITLWQKIKEGEVLSDAEMKQLFHAIDLQKYGDKTETERQDAEWARLYAEHKLAENMVANAERTETGEILIQGTPVRAEDALYLATQDIRHFQNTDTHLKPTQLMSLKKN